jgi:hypothetical protein
MRGRVHRDISEGNVLFDKAHGILGDLETVVEYKSDKVHPLHLTVSVTLVLQINRGTLSAGNTTFHGDRSFS